MLLSDEKNTYKATLEDAKIIVGDVGVINKVMPHIRSEKWANEAWLSISNPAVSTTTSFINGKLLIEGTYRQQYYVKEDNSLEYEIIFDKEPASNFITLNIDFPNGLVFAYQDTLENEWAKDSWGLTLEDYLKGRIRPDNVVGSYAVYWNETNNQYKTGKFCHIYRPKLIDAASNEIWADIEIDAITKTLTITMDANWLHNAVYPVVLDPNLGYDSQGGSYYDASGYKGVGRYNVTAGSDGTALKVWTYTHSSGDGENCKLGVYDGWGAGSSLIDQGELVSPTGDQWNSVDVDFAISNGVDYFPVIAFESSTHGVCYDSGGSGTHAYNISIIYGNEMLATMQATTAGALYLSIYIEYTAAGETYIPRIIMIM